MVQHVVGMRPVVLRGLSSKWRWRRRWQRQVFVKKFHEHNFSCADVPYKSQFLREGAEGGTEQMRLGEFLQLSDEAVHLLTHEACAPQR